MWWPKAALAVAMALAAAGCGFHPLYGSNPSTPALAPQLAAIQVRQMSGQLGQEMTTELRNAFNPHDADVDQDYELSISLIAQRADLLQRQDGTASRTDSALTANWTLTRLSDKKIVTSGMSRALTGHDILPNEYANVVSINTDLARAVHEVSAEIETRIAYYLQQPT